MNKKIKIIEILNIISNGEYEKLPLNIEVDGKKYNWDILEHFYNRKDSDREDLLELARKYDTITFLDMIAEVLDDSVEDNTEEIEELKRTQNVYDMTLECYHDIEKEISNDELADKINEIIRYIKRKDKNE